MLPTVNQMVWFLYIYSYIIYNSKQDQHLFTEKCNWIVLLFYTL